MFVIVFNYSGIKVGFNYNGYKWNKNKRTLQQTFLEYFNESNLKKSFNFFN